MISTCARLASAISTIASDGRLHSLLLVVHQTNFVEQVRKMRREPWVQLVAQRDRLAEEIEKQSKRRQLPARKVTERVDRLTFVTSPFTKAAWIASAGRVPSIGNCSKMTSIVSLVRAMAKKDPTASAARI